MRSRGSSGGQGIYDRGRQDQVPSTHSLPSLGAEGQVPIEGRITGQRVREKGSGPSHMFRSLKEPEGRKRGLCRWTDFSIHDREPGWSKGYRQVPSWPSYPCIAMAQPILALRTLSPPLTVIHWALLAFSEAPCLDGTNGSFLGAPSVPSMC